MSGPSDASSPQDWARPVVHWAITARDPEAQKAFYAALFGWTIGEGPIMTIDPGLGGPEPGPGGHIQEGDAPGVSLYVQVASLERSLERVLVELGGAARSGAFDVPGGPTIVFAADPEGNPLTFVQQ